MHFGEFCWIGYSHCATLATDSTKPQPMENSSTFGQARLQGLAEGYQRSSAPGAATMHGTTSAAAMLIIAAQ